MKSIRSAVIMIMLLSPFLMHGQLLNAGFRAGLNSNQFISNKSFSNQDNARIGFAGGMFLRLKVGSFSLQPEMIFSNKRGLIPYSSLQESTDTFFRASLQNLDIPIIANLHLGKHLRLGTGPVVTYGLKEKISFNTSASNYEIFIEKDVFKKASYSWQFAGALEFKHLIFEARYELGIDKLNYEFNIPNQTASFDPVIHSRTWQFTLGYKFASPR